MKIIYLKLLKFNHFYHMILNLCEKNSYEILSEKCISLETISEVKEELILFRNQINDKNVTIYLNVIPSEVLINTIYCNSKKDEIDVNLVLESLYPNVLDQFEVESTYCKSKEKENYIKNYLFPKGLKEEYADLKDIPKAKVKVNLDLITTSFFLKNHSSFFNKKNTLLILNDYFFYRIYRINNAQITGFLIMNDETFNLEISELLKQEEYDQIYLNTFLKDFNNLKEEYPSFNLLNLSDNEELVNLDYEKLYLS